MKGRVFEEKCLEQGSRGGGVDAFACGDDVVQLVLAFEDDECSGFRLRHVHAGLDVRLDIERRALGEVVFPEKESFLERVASERGFGADEKEEFPDFGLEDDDESDEADAHNLAEECAREAHVEEVGNLSCYDYDENCPEDADDVGAADEAVEIEKERRYQEDVDDIDEADGMEACDKCEHGWREFRG